MLLFAGRFGATRVLKQEGQDSGNKDLGICSHLAKYFFDHGIQNPIQFLSSASCSVALDLQLQEV